MENLKETEQIKELVEEYFKDDKNFVQAKIAYSVVELEFQNINENLHQTLIPHIKENVGFMINFKYINNQKFMIFA